MAHLCELLEQARPQGALFEEERRSWDRDALIRSVRQAASKLQVAGVQPGDRVLITGKSSLAQLAAWFGTVAIGATVCPAPIGITKEKLMRRARRLGASFAIGDKAQLSVLEELGLRALSPEALAGQGPELSEWIANPACEAMVLFSSGTTGRSTGVVIDHAPLLEHTRGLAEHTLDLDDRDVALNVLPLAHSFGIRMNVLVPLATKTRVVLARKDGRFDADFAMKRAYETNASWLSGVPTIFHRLADAAPEPLSTFRWGLSAGASLPAAIRERAERRLGGPICEGYGLTEASFSALDVPAAERTPGSVGRPSHGVRIRIVAEDGSEALQSESGEIVISGPNLGRALDGESLTPSGELQSGDLGFIKDGKLFVQDRLKDLIIRGGKNVIPAEIEAMLVTHPDILEAAVVGVPDESFGEEVAAALVCRNRHLPDDFESWARSAFAPSERPRKIQLVDALPLGPSRKVLRREIRKLFA